MSSTIKIKGQDHPVTEAWALAVFTDHPDLADRSTAALETERDNILRLSGERRRRLSPMPEESHEIHATLSPAEGGRLESVVHVLNVHYAAAMLEGRDPAEFGFTGIDQVHGNDGPAFCGCALAFVFDHHIHMAQAWARDLLAHKAVSDELAADPTAPPFAFVLHEAKGDQLAAGFAHHRTLAGHPEKAPAEILALELKQHPHKSYFACRHHKHLASDPAAHHATATADSMAAGKAIAAAQGRVAKAAAAGTA